MTAPRGRNALALRPLSRVPEPIPTSREPRGVEADVLRDAIAAALAPLAGLAEPSELAFLEAELRHAATSSPRLRRWLELAALEASGDTEVSS